MWDVPPDVTWLGPLDGCGGWPGMEMDPPVLLLLLCVVELLLLLPPLVLPPEVVALAA